MKNNIIIQDFMLEIKGINKPFIKTSIGKHYFVFFGFNQQGEVLLLNKEDQFVTIKQEWIEERIDFYIKKCGKNNIINGVDSIYVAILKRLDKPNAIAIMLNENPIEIYDSSIRVIPKFNTNKVIDRHSLLDFD